MTFFKELRDRSLFKILFAYLAAGWVGLEVVNQLNEQEILPAAAYQVVLIWYLCGIPGAVIVGWYHGEKGKQHATRLEVAMLVVIAFGALGASAPTISDEFSRRLRVEAAAESDLDLRRVAVLYLEDLTPGGEAQHLADGLTEALIDELTAVRELDIVSRNGVAQFRGLGLSPDSVARVLETGTIVDGTIEQLGEERLRLSVRLVDGQSGAVFSRTGFERPTADLLSARDELAEQAALLLRNWLGAQVDLRRTRRATESVPAWALHQRAEKARKDAEAALEHGDMHSAEEAFLRADQLLSQAQLVDAEWVEPSVLRARIAYRRARLAAGTDTHQAVDWIAAGLSHVERVLAVQPNQAEALELRGTFKYLHHLLGVEHDPRKDAALFVEARADLERAVSLEPTLSSAYAMLGHLYLNADDIAASVLAGRRAFEEDAYVENAPTVLWRLVNGLYNLEQFADAGRWCDEGRRRFDEDHRFVVCQLLLLTTTATRPDPDLAWELLARLDSLAPEKVEWERIRGEMFVGGVLARAGLPDSARAVLLRARSRTSPQIDPEGFMYSLEAHMRTLLGDDDEAIDLLTELAATRPDTDLEGRWWWRSLRDHPRFQELVTLTSHH